MNQKWQKSLGAALLALAAAMPLTGCAGRTAPAPRPEPVSTAGQIRLDPAVSEAAAGVGGAGTVESVLIGNVALLAFQLNAAVPGGTQGTSLTGQTGSHGRDTGKPGSGPQTLQGPGGSTGVDAARPGGGIVPGGATPGGTPNWTQATPNTQGTLATQNGTHASPTSVPSAFGATPMDVMNRMADQVKSRFNNIREVRFAVAPDEASRLAAIAREIRTGARPAESYRAELEDLSRKAVPAGTTSMPSWYPPTGTHTPARR